jgi:hypothetical protein
MKKMLNAKWAMAALIAASSFNAANAQVSLGESCGCPPLSQRTTVDFSTLVDINGNLSNPVTTLTCNNTYRLNVRTFVQDGAKLFIQAGTVIRGVFGLGAASNSLVVTRGGKIFAMGTEFCPIIMTDENDPLDGSYSINIRGQWGSLVVLGKAPNNLTLAANGVGLGVADGVGTIEGLLPGDPRTWYGGNDPNDSSGIIRYLSLRHGGTNIGEGNEINGLTLGSVGRGTVVEYVEVIANDDDGFEMFGGNVDLKYCTAFACNDDYFDFDHGWQGRGQFWFGVQLQGPSPQGDEGFEADGDDQDSGNQPFTQPTIYNVTLIGRGANRGVEARAGFAGRISNCIFANFPTGIDIANNPAHPFDSFAQYNAGNLVVTNNIFQGATNILRISGAAPSPATLATFTAAGNTIANVIDAQYSMNITTNAVTNAYNAVPANVALVASPESAPIDDFFCGANYKGAFAPGQTPWTANWTLSALLSVDNALVNCPADINKDGQINVNDFLELLPVFGTSCGL